ncbi:esterase, partial [bacterium]
AYLGLRHPEAFGRLGICSPSVWWDSRVLLRLAGEIPKKASQRVWIDMGTKEGENSVTNAEDLAKVYESKGWRQGRDLALVIEAGKEHNEAAWAGRFDAMMTFLWK